MAIIHWVDCRAATVTGEQERIFAFVIARDLQIEPKATSKNLKLVSILPARCESYATGFSCAAG